MKQKEKQVVQNIRQSYSLYTALKRFYINDLMSIIKGYKRGYYQSTFLIIAKAVLQLTIVFNQSVIAQMIQIESYFQNIRSVNVQETLQEEDQLCMNIVIFFLCLNSVFLIYIFIKFIFTARKSQEKNNSLKLLLFLKERDKYQKEQGGKILDILFSVIASIYQYIILIPSILFSGVYKANISSINVTLSIIISKILLQNMFNYQLLNHNHQIFVMNLIFQFLTKKALLISNNDYDYLISSKDFLRQKYIDFQMFFSLFEVIAYYIISILDSSTSLLILFLVLAQEIFRLVFFQPYFIESIQILLLFINNFLMLSIITLYALINTSTNDTHQFGLFIVIFLPISYKMSQLLQLNTNNKYFKNFEASLIQNQPIDPSTLNYVARQLVFNKQRKEIASDHEEIQSISYLIQSNQTVKNIMLSDKFSQHKQQREQLLQQLQSTYGDIDINQFSLLGDYKVDSKIIEGKEYVFKEQAYGENVEQKKTIYKLFIELFQRQRRHKQFGMIDIYYLVFIVEVLQNFQKFEMVLTQSQKNLDAKSEQILQSILQEVEKQKESMHLSKDDSLVFSYSYYEALVFDELINQTATDLEEAVQKKISLLFFMKQRHIELEEISVVLEDLLQMRQNLINQISIMIQTNEYNPQLYNIYLSYLETISFSETDIHLEKYNKFKKEEQQKLFRLNSVDTCVLFSSLKSEKETKITKVSNNFFSFLGISEQLVLNRPIETLMPAPFAEQHKHYVSSFFDRGQTVSNLKNQLLFAINHSNHLIPVNIDVKINVIQLDNDFGLTGFMQKVQNQTQYVLFDSTTSRLISMTQELNQFVFPSLKHFSKVSIAQFFPFVLQYRTNYLGGILSSPYSKTSQLTQNSVKTFYMNSNKAISFQGIKSVKTLKSKFKSNFNQKNEDQSYKQEQKESAKHVEKEINLEKRKKKGNDDKNQNFQGRESFELDEEENQIKNLQFLLVISQYVSQKQNQSNNNYNKFVSGISEYLFFTMNISVQSYQYNGLGHIKCIEITQVKQISPVHNAKFIKSVYNNAIDGYQTNFHQLNSPDIQCILSELEINSVKESTIREQGMDSSDSEKSEAKVEKKLTDDQILDNNNQILFNRYPTDDQQRVLQNNLKAEDQVYEDKLDNNELNVDNLRFLETTQQLFNNTQDKSQVKLYPRNISQEQFQQSFDKDIIERQYLQDDQMHNEHSTHQFKKNSAFDVSALEDYYHKNKNPEIVNDTNNISYSFIQKDFQTNVNRQLINPQSFTLQQKSYPQDMLQQPNDLLQSPLEFIQSPINQTLSPLAGQQAIFPLFSPDATSPMFQSNVYAKSSYLTFSNNNEISKGDQSTKAFAQTSFKKNQQLQPLNNQLKNNSTTILSPGNNNSTTTFTPQQTKYFVQNSTLKEQKAFQNNDMEPEQNLNDMIVRNSLNLIKRQNTQSCHSLSKKRKRILLMHETKIKNIRDAIDQSSNHSRESTQSSQLHSTKSIILQKFTLGVMKIVNIVGICSFLIILIVVLQQYFSMNSIIEQFSLDLKFADWATQFQIGLSSVMKYFNYARLLEGDYLLVSKDKVFKKTEVANINQLCIDSVNNVKQLEILATTAGTQRLIVQKMIDRTFTFKQGAAVDRTIPLGGQAYYIFNLIDQDMSLLAGAIRIFAYLFRYSRNVGLGIPQWIVVNNSESMVKDLLLISEEVQSQSLSQLLKIQQDLQNVLVTIIIVSAFCIFIIIPVYSFIQSKREQIIQLFGTFSPNYIDSCIQEIQDIYSRNNNLKKLSVRPLGQENLKRQVLSSTSKLNRSNTNLYVASIIAFIITLPYPILNQVLSTQYIEQNKVTLPMLSNIFQGIQNFSPFSLFQFFSSFITLVVEIS